MSRDEGSIVAIAAPIIASILGAAYIASMLFASYRAVMSEERRLGEEAAALGRIAEAVELIANGDSPEADSLFDAGFHGDGTVSVEDMSLACLDRQRDVSVKPVTEGGCGFVHPLVAERDVIVSALRTRSGGEGLDEAFLASLSGAGAADAERVAADAVLRDYPELWPAISIARPVNINLAPAPVIEEAGRRGGLTDAEARLLSARIIERRLTRELNVSDAEELASAFAALPRLRYYLGVKSWFIGISLEQGSSLFYSVYCATPSEDGKRAMAYDMLAFYREDAE